jgi:hypothetical protein
LGYYYQRERPKKERGLALDINNKKPFRIDPFRDETHLSKRGIANQLPP